MKILVAEDDRVLAQLLASRLRKAGLTVLLAFDAMQSLMLAIQQCPSAIILDISMPGGNGLDILKKLKNSNKTSLIPVLVLSGSVDPQISDTVKELGAEEFFTKPPDFEKLQRALDRLLGKPQGLQDSR